MSNAKLMWYRNPLIRNIFLSGECKWRDDIDSEGLKEELLKKAASLPFVKNHSIIPAVFLKSY